MKQIFLFLILSIFTLNAQNITVVKPQLGAEEVSRTPQMRIQTEFPIDTSTFYTTSPHVVDSSRVMIDSVYDFSQLPAISLFKDDYYDYTNDTLQLRLSVPIDLLVVDSTTILIALREELDFENTYSLRFGDNFKLLKPDTSKPDGIDTMIVQDTLIRNYFTTISYPLSIKNINLSDNSIIDCSEEFYVEFNKDFSLGSLSLDSVFKLYKVGDKISDTLNNTCTYENISVPINIQSSDNNRFINISPVNSYDLGENYYIKINLNYISNQYSENYFYNFKVLDQVFFNASARHIDTNKAIPLNMGPLLGTGDRVITPGDTAYITVPLYNDTVSFKEWAVPHHHDFITINNNQIMLTPDCADLKELHTMEFIALYEEIPLDTLTVEPAMVYDENTHLWSEDTCSYVQVTNYEQEISPGVYTYRRYNDAPLMVDYIPCDAVEFREWISENPNHDESTEPMMIVGRSDILPNSGNQFGSWQIGAKGDLHNPSCSDVTLEVEIVKVYSPTDDNENPFGMFGGTINFDGQPQTLTQTTVTHNLKQCSAAVASVTYPNSSKIAQITGQLNSNNYEIAGIFDSRVRIKKGWKYNQYNFENWLGNSLNESLEVKSTDPGCENKLTIYVRRKVHKFEYEITRDQNGDVPSINIARLDFEPEPPGTLNEIVTLGNGVKTYNPNSLNKYINVDEDGYRHVTKRYNEVYFFKGTNVNISTYSKENSGYKHYSWNNEPGYEAPSILSLEEFDEIINNDKKTNWVLSTDFIIEYISIHKNRIQRDLDGETGAEMSWVKFRPPNYDSESTIDTWPNNDIDKNFGMGLLYPMSISPENWPVHISDLHKFVPQIILHFSHPVDETTLPDNIIIEDRSEYNGHINGLRHDGHPLVDNYGIRFNGDKINAVKTSSNQVKITLVSDYDENAKERWMPNMQKFSIKIRNNPDGSHERIKSISGAELSNFIHYSSNIPELQGITSNPGIRIKTKRFDNIKFPRRYIGPISGFKQPLLGVWHATISHSSTSTLPDYGKWVKWDENNLVQTVDYGFHSPAECVRVPKGTSFYDSREIYTIDQILEDQTILSVFHIYDNKSEDPRSDTKLINWLIDAIALIDIDINSKEDQEEEINGLSDALQLLLQTFKSELVRDSDELRGTIAYYLSERNNGSNKIRHNFKRHEIKKRKWIFGLWLSEWDELVYELEKPELHKDYSLWGAGYYGLYSDFDLLMFDDATTYDVIQEGSEYTIIYKKEPGVAAEINIRLGH